MGHDVYSHGTITFDPPVSADDIDEDGFGWLTLEQGDAPEGMLSEISFNSEGSLMSYDDPHVWLQEIVDALGEGRTFSGRMYFFPDDGEDWYVLVENGRAGWEQALSMQRTDPVRMARALYGDGEGCHPEYLRALAELCADVMGVHDDAGREQIARDITAR